MIVSIAAFKVLALTCGPSVHVETLASVARTESAFNSLAIGDNTAHRSYAPASVEQAIQTANALLARGHSLDLGLMQINTKNLRGLGLSVADTFDTCKNVRAGARVLVEGYRPAGVEDSQATLLRALSHYNTGNQQRGFTNGYVRRVQYAAQQVVPAIRLGGSPVVVTGPEGGEGPVAVQPPAPPPAPPSWDMYASARYRRENGDVVTVQPQAEPQQSPQAPTPTGPAPVMLQAAPAGSPDSGM
ncbi:lytic transglycosylase domain-containing protein [Sphingomonas montana]|uniref:lytic transglycosylase domain-containing protein n=1 Tax=Sphingomonas montana TaxID=1843236 RepID=UPI00097016B0|nr:lytic transglycosylase domain-containing protein [Sphingomonas montana]